MKKLKKEKINKSTIVIMCSFLVIIICLINIFFIILNNYNENKIEEEKIESFFETQEEIKEEVQEVKEEVEVIETSNNVVEEEYLGVLEIKKINLKKGFYSIDSKNNNLKKSIKVLDESQMPDIENGNLIIAGHSGNSNISYFRNLSKLEIGDEATIYYDGKTFNYKLVSTYEIDKNGTAHIIRNIYKNTLTLITCKHNTDKQLVFIFELY